MILLLTFPAWGQSDASLHDQVKQYTRQHQEGILLEFAELLSVPNVASDTANIRRNAEHIVAMMQKRGISARLLEHEGAPPIVYGELLTPGAKHTLIMYAHYDGQPVAAAQWDSPPWQPVLRDDKGQEVQLSGFHAPLQPEYRIYARSAGDDKAPIEAVLAALDALKAADRSPSVNMKFFFEGEEEAGSPHLPQIIAQYRGLLSGDAWLLCDGPVHQSRKMQVFFGARGVTGVEMTIYGPSHAMHSGHYGNWAPNPAVMMAHLLAGMRDENGKILIAGYYDQVRPLTASEREAIRRIPDVDEQLKKELALGRTEGAPEPLALRIMRPALNVRGISSGHVGDEAQNAVPVDARASLDLRLVPDQRPERVRALVEEHIRKLGYTIVNHEPTPEERMQHARIIRLQWDEGYPPARTSMDLPVSRAVVAAIEKNLGAPVIKVPMLGGSVPMYLFLDELKTPVIGVPIANHDDNQHAHDENLRLQNLWDGIQVFAGIIAESGAQAW